MSSEPCAGLGQCRRPPRLPLLLITAAIMAIGLGTVYSATYDSTTA
jgi:hypothetical protein